MNNSSYKLTPELQNLHCKLIAREKYVLGKRDVNGVAGVAKCSWSST